MPNRLGQHEPKPERRSAVESPIAETHEANTLRVYGRIELLPMMASPLAMHYYRQGIFDAVALNEWNESMGGRIDAQPTLQSDASAYHYFGRCCVARKQRTPVANIHFDFEIVQGDA